MSYSATHKIKKPEDTTAEVKSYTPTLDTQQSTDQNSLARTIEKL